MCIRDRSCTCIDITLWVTPVWITRLWVSHWVIPVHSDCECHYDMHALPPSQQLPSTLPSTITYNILNMLHAEILNTCRFITTILTLRTCLHCCHHEKVHQVAADPTTKSTNCGCESACTLLSSTLTITVYYYSADTHFSISQAVECCVNVGRVCSPCSRLAYCSGICVCKHTQHCQAD